MKFFRSLPLLFVLAAITLAACGRPAASTAPDVAGLPELDPVAILSQARTYYNGGVQRETNNTYLWRKFELTMNTFRTGASDLIANNKSCFKDVAVTEAFIGDAVTSNMDGDQLFGALVTQSVSGEQATTECTKLNRQVADFIISNRAAVMDSNLAAFNGATEYIQYTSAFPEVDFMNDLMQTYGDTTIVYQKLADAGIGVSDWSWLPTANLWVSHSDETLCRYYITGAFMENLPYSMKLKFTGHETALARLYESSWNPAANAGRGECRMTRYAALEYMTRSIVSADTQNVIEGGQDTGVFPTEVPTVVP